MFKVIVSGSRGFNDYEFLKRKLDVALIHKVSEGVTIISGTARGADKLGERYATEKGYNVIRMPADWDTYGKRAGYIRNEEMAKIADALAAFWDGKSRGTYHMINIAKRYRLPTIVVNYIDNRTYKLNDEYNQ